MRKRLAKGLRLLVMASAVAAVAAVAPASAIAGDRAEMQQLWSALDDNGRQTIKAAAGQLGSSLTAPKDSPNGRFWGALLAEGYLESVDLVEVYGEAAAPAMQAAGFQIYRVTFEGARKLPDLLEDLAKP